jgi:hypothetical protein
VVSKTTKKMKAADEILNQLGGNKFIAMTGATCYSDNNGNTLVAKFKGSKIANIVYVTINSMDTYDVKICKYRGMNVNTVKEVEGVYCDQLRHVFEQVTKLYTKL